jgi:hypothetical protein
VRPIPAGPGARGQGLGLGWGREVPSGKLSSRGRQGTPLNFRNLCSLCGFQAQGYRYPRPASVPPSPSLSRHSSPHQSEDEEEPRNGPLEEDGERYDEDAEAAKDRRNIRAPEWPRRTSCTSSTGGSKRSSSVDTAPSSSPSTPSEPLSPASSVGEERN